MIIGYFDFLVFGVLILCNILFWNKTTKHDGGCIIGGLLFGLILPIISMNVEINKVTGERVVMDNFTLLYVYLKFPVYWLTGSIQSLVFSLKNRKPED